MSNTDTPHDTLESLPERQQIQVLRALETANQGISLLDDRGEFVYVNEAYARTYGYDCKEMLGLHWETLYPEGMSDEVYEDILPALEEDGTWTGETPGIRRDGSELIEDHYLAKTEDGGLICVVRDITEQRHLEHELEQVYERITDAVVGVDSSLRVTQTNDRARELFDLEDGAIETPLRVALPDGVSLEATIERATAEREPQTVRHEAPALDRWFEFRVFPSDTGATLYVQDVTAEQTQRSQLEAQERALRKVYEVVSDQQRDFEAKVDALLGICREIIGTRYATFSKVEGDTYRFEVVKSPDDSVCAGDVVDVNETNCERAIDTGEALVLGDVNEEAPDLACRAANRDLGLESYLGAPVNCGDDVWGTFCFYDTAPQDNGFSDWDVTLVELLSRWVGYELERLQRQEELETSNERLSEFTHAVSHDLQEPVRTVSTYAQLLEDRYGDELDDDGVEYLEFVSGGADRMREMIDKLLEYARIDTRDAEYRSVDLADVATTAVADLATKIDANDAVIDVGSLPTVDGDASQLRQVFQNLIDNAIEYNEGTPRIEVTAERDDPAWKISVKDNGIGIDPEAAETVFGVFERLHTDEEYSGTGLGLSLCERIVGQHGGDIWVDSDPGEGTTVSFTLPAPDVDGDTTVEERVD